MLVITNNSQLVRTPFAEPHLWLPKDIYCIRCIVNCEPVSLLSCKQSDVVAMQTYSKKAVDQVQEALTQAQKTQVLSQNIFEVLTSLFHP